MKNKIILIGFLLFAVWGFSWLDPDFGWHVKMGELILSSGVARTDPFSYTMANFPFVDHEWLTNVLMYVGYESLGMGGLAVISALGVVGAVMVAVPKRWWRWVTIPALLAYSIWWQRAGVRPQIEDWVLLPLAMRIVGEDKLWKKWGWWLPGIMMMWANLHGGFVVGLAITGTIVMVKMWEKKEWDMRRIGVWGMSFLATFINPYGGDLWREVVQQLTDRRVGSIILEWKPFYTKVEIGWLFLVVWAGFLGWRYRKSIEPWRLVVTLGTFLASIFSLRHAAIFAVVALPVCAQAGELMEEELVKNKLSRERMDKFMKGVKKLAGGILIATIWASLMGYRMDEDKFYPTKAITWLKENEVKGQLYADYGWGGYLDWKYPEQKVFIDGRMATWKWKSPDSKYSDYVFDEYVDVAFLGKWSEWFEKYQVETVLTAAPRETEFKQWLRNMGADKSIKSNSKDEVSKLGKELMEAGWKKVYGDEVAEIYKK